MTGLFSFFGWIALDHEFYYYNSKIAYDCYIDRVARYSKLKYRTPS